MHNVDSRRQLAELQNVMAQTIMRPLTSTYQMRKRWTDGQPINRVANTFIKPNRRLSSGERLEIYNRQYWFRLLTCFYDDFTGVHAILGDRQFKKLAFAYLTRYPSSSFTLRNLGCHLTQFMAEEPEWIKSYYQLAMDMARLEWAHILAFDEAELTPINAESLRNLDPQSVHLTLQPYLSLLALNYPVDDLRIELKKGNEPRGDASNAMGHERRETHIRRVKRLKPKMIYLAVHRLENIVYYKRLEADAFQILTALRDGVSLNEACSRAGAVSTLPIEEQSQTIRQWFHDWTSFGWFVTPNSG